MKIKQLWSLFAVAILMAALIPAGQAGAAGTTTVRSSDVGVTWFTASPAADTRTGGNVSFVNGPATAPLGNGSLQMTTTDANGGDQAKAQAVTGAYVGTPLSAITSLSYYAYRDSASTNSTAQTISLNIAVDYLGTGSSFTTLVFEPVYQPGGVGAMQLNTWQMWDALANGDAKWWSTKPIPGVCDFNCFVPWSTILANNPNAKIKGIVGFNVGSGWTGQFKGAVDLLTVGISGTNTTYDFEPELPCTTVCYADAVNGNDANGGASPGNAKKTIQAAIDAVNANGQVRVLPGNYNETATGRMVLGANGPHQFGLFVAKDGVTIQGVTAGDAEITDPGSAGAYITTNATNNFGYSGIFVEGDNVTLAGLHIGPNIPGDNKTIEIIGDGFTLKDSHVDVPGGGSIYFDDWQFDTASSTSHVQSYTVDHNLIDQSTSIDITSGAGYSGPVSGRRIVNNEFENANYWPSISFNGSNTGVPWFVYSVGGAVIENNTFTNTFNGADPTAGHIRTRGDVDNSEFDWALYWMNNTFNKAVVILDGAPFSVRQYSYTNGAYSFSTRRIGVNIQGSVDKAFDGDTVLVHAGTYNETINVENRNDLTITGEDAATTIVKPSTTLPWNIGGYGTNRQAVLRVVNSTGITIDGLTFDLDLVKGNFKFAALLWDTTGSLTGNIFKNNTTPDANGGYYEFGIATRTSSPAYTAASRAPITISGNTFVDMGRVAMLIHNFVDATIINNTIYKTLDDFGYGIELGSQATGIIGGNTIYGFDTPAASDNSNSAGIYIENSFTSTEVNGINKNITIKSNEVYGSQWALYLGNEFSGYAGNVDIVAEVSANNFHDNADGAVLVTDEDKSAGSSVTANFANNSVSNNGSAGYYIYTWGDGDIKINITGDVISGNDIGVYMNDFASGTTASTYQVAVNRSSIAGNNSFGVQNEFTDATLDATCNWWGAGNGPSGAGSGSGDLISTNAIFLPWLFTSDLNGACSTPPSLITAAEDAFGYEGDTLTATGEFSGVGLTLTADNSVGSFVDNSDGTWSWTFVTTDDEAGTITVTATDAYGNTVIDSFEYGTNNVAPTVIVDNVSPTLVAVGAVVNASGSFTDPGTSDTHTAEWDWGDQTSSSGSVSGLDVGPDSHIFTAPGIYTLNLTVTDDDGGVGTAAFEFIVVYDPSGGFVTGGGWIDSPVNTNYQYMGVAGKATFGFVSKYKKGATVPEGNTEFQFKAGSLSFHSTSYQWLVVNQGGTNAQFKGYGTINGAGSYSFMLWATDGAPDTFRIQIWDTDTDVIVYDNGSDQPIGGGSIVVHRK